MSNQGGMSDDELESMLSDLESEQGGADFDDEEMDGMLSELEEDIESAPSPDREPDDLELEAPELAEEAQEMEDELGDLDLDGLEGDDELPVKGGEGSAIADEIEVDPSSSGASETSSESEATSSGDAASSTSSESVEPDEETSSTSESSSDSEERSPALAWTLFALKWVATVIPSVALWWMVGSYLGQWISAGWLIASVSTIFVLGAPAALYQGAGRWLENRGRFRWWLLGFGVIMTTLLVAPMSEAAGSALAHYGHWPAQTIAELTGTSPEASFWVDLNKTISQGLGRLLDAGAGSATSLGSAP